ncbi:hypothetical protein UFOVP1196_89 [uncultured Caudovirales phage]|uniref:Uncharacterized protein n=1 Tax=uncultured Caudovirales phage TaxID=2100421 RepID=A0A6J5R1U7_9CAUD|nr:hypothetical protein UFOVP1196_89 [uncultured Caudovirales phage]
MRFLLSLVLALSIVPAAACTPKNVTVAPDAQQAFKTLQVVKVVNDVTTGVIAANAAGQLSDQAAAQVLNVNKQVLDVIQADKVTGVSKALVIVQNARQALPPNLVSLLSGYMQKLIDGLKGTL